MYKAYIVAQREYLALLTTKSFAIGLIVAPLIALLTLSFAPNREGPSASGPRQVLVVDRSSKVSIHLEKRLRAEGLEVLTATEGSLSGRTARTGQQPPNETLLAAIELDADVLSDSSARVRVSVHNIGGMTAHWLSGLVRQSVLAARARQAGLNDGQIELLLQPIEVDLASLEADGALPEWGAAASMLLPFLTQILVLMGITTAATLLLQAVIEEKQQRITEVLLGAVSPTELMWGKLLGGTALGATVVCFYIVIGSLAALYLGYAEHLPFGTIAVALLASVLAMLMYGSLFLSLGAMASDLKDAQGLMMPLMLVLVGPLLAMPALLDNPHGPIALALSLFPLTAPMALSMRLSVSSSVPHWQILISLLLLVGATASVLWAGGRIFRIGILSQGKVPSLKELGLWLLRG